MKKILSFALTLLLALGVATGCGAVLLFGAGSGGSAVCFAVIGLFAAALALSKLIKGKENG